MVADVVHILSVMDSPALLIGPDDRIRAANDPVRNLLGSDLENRHFITVLRQPILLDGIEAVQQKGGKMRTRYLASDGEHDLTFRVTCGAVPMSGGRGVLLSFEDITPMETAGQMRRDFVANVSHELRTPLTSLLGFIETLQGPARDDPVARDRFLRIMQDEAGRMNRLVSDLLSLSRVEDDERVRPTEKVDLTGVIRSVAHRLSQLAEDSQIALTLELPETEMNILADADQLRQVLTNLIENGIKYSEAGDSVTVRLTGPTFENGLRGQGVRIVVEDSGPGIDPVHIPRLTERFYRADNHRSRELGGTGLGLAIVKHIINRHRGRMRIESELGKGARFTVILPTGV